MGVDISSPQLIDMEEHHIYDILYTKMNAMRLIFKNIW